MRTKASGGCASETDRRGRLTRLTAEGMALVERAAPGHVEEVRRLVFDPLDPEEMTRLEVISSKLILAPLDAR